MFNPRRMLVLAFACVALGISLLPAIASAETSPLAGAFTTSTTTSTANCPSGKCFEEAAEWIPGTVITVSGGSASSSGGIAAIIRETPVSKLKKIKKSYEKKYKVIVGYYQNPNGWQGPDSECVKIEKVKAWHTKPGDYIHTTDHVGHGRTAKLRKGEKICHFHLVHINGHPWIEGTEGICSNVHTRFPIDTKIRKPRRVYVQFPTVEKFYEVAIKRLEIKSEGGKGSGEGGGATYETPGHYQCKPGGVLNGNMCKYCPPPSCEPEPCNTCEPEPCTSCEPEPCNTCKEPPRVENVYKIQEVYTDEPIQFCADVYAPPGDNIKILFVTEYGTFSPREIKIASYGSQSHFCTTYTAPSEPVFDHVHVFVQDNTTGKTCKSPDQLVEVQSREENPV